MSAFGGQVIFARNKSGACRERRLWRSAIYHNSKFIHKTPFSVFGGGESSKNQPCSGIGEKSGQVSYAKIEPEYAKRCARAAALLSNGGHGGRAGGIQQ